MMAYQASSSVDEPYPDLPEIRGFSRRQYGELHPKDQAVKTSKRLQIESNWGVDIQECLPPAIRPKCELKKGSKARVGDAILVDEVWWNWSVELLKCVEELSSMTVNDIEYARTLLSIEVGARQENPKSTQRKIAELLLGDAQRVVDDTRRKANTRAATQGPNHGVYQDNNQVDAMEYQSDPYSTFRNGNNGQMEHVNGGQDYEDEQYTGQGSGNGNGDYGFSPDNGSGGYPFSPPNGRAMPEHSYETMRDNPMSLSDQLKMTELKARVARLKAEAARVEAQATQLELMARELRERVETGEE